MTSQLHATASLAMISLEELNAAAELLARTDRKYIVDSELLGELLADLGDRLAVLQIGGQREFAYESVYFDTGTLELYRAAATGRSWRYKVRIRHYVDSDLAMLEVKTKDGRGRTLKHRRHRSSNARDRLTDDDCRFIDDIVQQPGSAVVLEPSLTTRYRRATVVDIGAGGRATFDRELECAEPDGCSVQLDRVIIETKSDGPPGPLDRWLWRQGQRPVRMSKYCTVMAALHPELPANKWHHTLAHHFPSPTG